MTFLIRRSASASITATHGASAVLHLKNWAVGLDLPDRVTPPTAGGGIVIAWAGMRGIVSLAAALALPTGFPERDLIQFVAFMVVIGTLFIQGFTLGPLVRLLRLPDDMSVNREIDLARRRAIEAAIGALEGNPSEAANALRVEYQAVIDMAERQDASEARRLTDHETLRVEAVKAARGALTAMRTQGEIGDLAFRVVEEALDRADIYAVRRGTGT